MRKKWIAALLAAALTCCGAAAGAASVSAYEAGQWNVYRGTDAELWEVGAEAIRTTKQNPAFQGNFLLTESANAVGDYQVSADFRSDTAVGGDQQELEFGLVPWYVDDGNFILVYLRWEAGVGSKLRNIEITGMQNGETIQIYAPASGTFESSQWNDIWVFNNPQAQDIAIPANSPDGFTIKVVKRHADGNFGNKAGDFILVYVNNNAVWRGFYSTSAAVPYRHRPAKAGLYAYKSLIEVKNFAVADWEENVYNYSPLVAGNADVVATPQSAWTAGENGYEAKAASAAASDPARLLVRHEQAGNYRLTAKAQPGGQGYSGVLPWYKDENNYVAAGLKADSGKRLLELTGKLNGVAIEAVSREVEFSGSAVLEVEKRGAKLVAGVGEQRVEYENVALDNGSRYYGLEAVGEDAVFTDIALEELPYNAYDEYDLSIAGKDWKASGETQYNFRQGEDGTLLADTRTAGQYTYLYRSKGDVYGEITVSARFSGIAAAEQGVAEYGVLFWVQNKDNYIGVTVADDGKLYAVKRISGVNARVELAALPGDFDFAADHAVSVKLTGNTAAVSLDGTEAASSSFEEIAGLETASGGVLLKGVSAAFDTLTFDGFHPYEPRTLGDWTAYGSRPGSWRLEGDKLIVNAADYPGGFKQVNAVQPFDYAETYYVGGEIKVRGGTAKEYKVGLFPWYLDSGNYVVVWYSLWTDSSTMEIVMHGMLNGAAWGAEWRVQSLTGVKFLDTANKMEVKVAGDQVSVYVNGSKQAGFVSVFDGLAAASADKQVYAGFNAYNVKAELASFRVSEGRAFPNTVPPEIRFLGVKPAAGTVGTPVQLPVVDVVDDLGEVINADVKVTDPSGKLVAEGAVSRFTPETAGTYTVTVTAKDSWGNAADPVTWTVTVSEKAAETPGGGSPGLTGAAVAGIAAGCVAGAILVGFAVYWFLLRKKK